jgi:SAM-dependent methyltransferase
MRSDLYDDLFVKEDRYWWHVNKRELVFSTLRHHGGALPPNPRVLEIGCGTGAMVQQWAAVGLAFGIDIAPEAAECCQYRGVARVCIADATRALPFPDESFDLVCMLDVLEHLADEGRTLRELGRILRPGGRTIISVPAYRWLWSYWDEALGHQRRYTRTHLLRTLGQAGLRVRWASYTNSFILPAAAAVRGVKSLRGADGKTGATDFLPVPPIVNAALVGLGRAERRLLQRWELPLGLSILSIAEKAGEGQGSE